MKLDEEDGKNIDEMQIVVFTLGDEEFGVDISQVWEIIKLTEITSVPDVPDYMEGIINLRGKIVTVIDLSKKLRNKAIEAKNETRIMIVNVHDNTLGMIVDSVSEVMSLSMDTVSPPPKNLSTTIHEDFIEGVGKLDERLIILLNLEGVLLKEHVKEITNQVAESTAEKSPPKGDESAANEDKTKKKNKTEKSKEEKNIDGGK